MIHKHPLCPERLRRVPERFSWVDHRLVRDHHLRGLHPEAAALYLFLLVVSDSRGLSHYGEAAITRATGLSEDSIARARRGLVSAGLIAHQRPLVQVLDLAPPGRSPEANRDAVTLGELFRRVMAAKEGGRDD